MADTIYLTLQRQTHNIGVNIIDSGPVGPDGPAGSDGFSPTITPTEITGGHRLVITDADGTRAVDVLDGTTGPKGDSGVYVGPDPVPEGTRVQVDPSGEATEVITRDDYDPVVKTAAMTQSVGVDEDGKLYTEPGSDYPPASGIPKSDLSSAVKDSLDLADASLQTADDSEETEIPHLVDADTLDNKSPAYYRNRKIFGKKLAVEGDSIMYGLGYNGGWAKIIAEKYGMTLVNNAVTGGTIREFAGLHCISSGILDLPADADYIIVDGGVNDFTRNTFVKGQVLSSSLYGYYNTWDDGGTTRQAPYETPSGFASLDTATFCGAFEEMCINLVTRFRGKKIGFVFNHRMIYAAQSDSGGGGLKWSDFVTVCKQILEKWGIPYIDIEPTAPLGMMQEYKTAYTNNGDGWHPNENGYKLFYVNPIEEWLETL